MYAGDVQMIVHIHTQLILVTLHSIPIPIPLMPLPMPLPSPTTIYLACIVHRENVSERETERREMGWDGMG